MFEDDERCAVVSSSVHEAWARTYSGSLETRLRYSPSDCFETYPFPRLSAKLGIVASNYHKVRSQVMLERQEGLTKIYNRVHTASDQSSDIARLRALKTELDEAVVGAYGWNDIALEYDFRVTKQGPRYAISDNARRDLLERLLALNHATGAEQAKARLAAEPTVKPIRGKAKPKSNGSSLFD
jgi:hypothetical protein